MPQSNPFLSRTLLSKHICQTMRRINDLEKYFAPGVGQGQYTATTRKLIVVVGSPAYYVQSGRAGYVDGGNALTLNELRAEIEGAGCDLYTYTEDTWAIADQPENVHGDDLEAMQPSAPLMFLEEVWEDDIPDFDENVPTGAHTRLYGSSVDTLSIGIVFDTRTALLPPNNDVKQAIKNFIDGVFDDASVTSSFWRIARQPYSFNVDGTLGSVQVSAEMTTRTAVKDAVDALATSPVSFDNTVGNCIAALCSGVGRIRDVGDRSSGESMSGTDTMFHRYGTKGTAIALGKDGGKTLPYDDVLAVNPPQAQMQDYEKFMPYAAQMVIDMRNALEALIARQHLVIPGTITEENEDGDLYTPSGAEVSTNFYYIATNGKIEGYGRTSPQYTWTRPQLNMVGTPVTAVDIGEIILCVEELERSQAYMGLDD